jgi:hypothetical protein
VGLLDARAAAHPLYHYAALYWGHNAHDAAPEAAPAVALVDNLIRRFFECQEQQGNVAAASQILINSLYLFAEAENDWSPNSMVLVQLSAAHPTAYFGLERLVAEFCREDAQDSLGMTPLAWAARNGHAAVVERLLENDDISAEAKDHSGRTPLLWVMWLEHEAVVALLLGSGKIDVHGELQAKPIVGFRDEMAGVAKFGFGVGLGRGRRGGRVSQFFLMLLGNQRALKLKLTPLGWSAFIGHRAVVEVVLRQDGIDLRSGREGSRLWPHTALVGCEEWTRTGGGAAAGTRWRRPSRQ